jgi:hypothetical protein
MKLILRSSFALVGALAAGLSLAQTNLVTGDAVTVPILAEPSLTIVDSLVSPYNTSTIDGTLTSIVAKTAATGDNLIFAWIISSTHSSTSTVGRFTTTGWDGWSAAVAQHQSSGFMVPGNTTSSADRFNPDVLGFNFDRVGSNSLAPGETSSVFWALSDATSYTTSIANVIDGSVAQVTTFAPVPEPGLMLAAGAGLAALARRRKKAQS